ncbi:MAG: aldo/keto reductase [Planctomycetota bacterium]|jgi:aryl-alcohol dehydrogenase-like predicted oxidoreductase
MNPSRRRDFLKASLASLAAAGFGWPAFAQQKDSPAGIPTRPLGKTGQRVPIVGLGGYHVGTAEPSEAIAIMHEAIDQGMTFFDNSWDYHDGGSEQLMGKALASGGRRDKVFLMTKVCARDYDGARQHLEESLRRLKTGHLDLWQFHEINWDVDPDWVFDRGALKCALEARKAGKVRFIGFTGHKDPAHHLKMLSKPFEWDTVQMPINVLDAHYRSFQKQVVPECTRRKIAVLGMKSLANGVIPDELGIAAETCRRFALSLAVSTLVCGICTRENLRQDLAVARSYKPFDDEEIKSLLAKTKGPGSDGKLEPFKTTRFGSAHFGKEVPRKGNSRKGAKAQKEEGSRSRRVSRTK